MFYLLLARAKRKAPSKTEQKAAYSSLFKPSLANRHSYTVLVKNTRIYMSGTKIIYLASLKIIISIFFRSQQISSSIFFQFSKRNARKLDRRSRKNIHHTMGLQVLQLYEFQVCRKFPPIQENIFFTIIIIPYAIPLSMITQVP